jgi:NAD(P)-dependent dehydrogenase (short-subunit alcohol dehydrogenase family)
MAEVAALVGPQEFGSVTALVVGGSRGLGAVTAKIIAAGGGRALITFAHAQSEAESVANDIRASRGVQACDLFKLDVFDAAARDLGRLQGRVTHLFYFATPQIFHQASSAFQPDRFLRFTEAYVIAFEAICTSLLGESGLTVFYPSSTAVEQRPRGMAEYSMAKAAGEILCSEMAASHKQLRMNVVRLPRILTDQTATVTPVESADALTTMLPIIRSLALSDISKQLS